MRTRLTIVTFVLLALGVLLAAPAYADVVAFTEGETESEEPAEEEQGSELGIVPAVEAPPEASEEDDAPWTQRFLAPTVLALGVLGIVGSLVYYGARIRGRYTEAR